MASWLTGSTADWNTSIRESLNRAASSVQKLTEQAELQNLSDKVRASAQSFAEQSEIALRDARHSVQSGNAWEALGFSGTEDAESASRRRFSDLVKRFEGESLALRDPNSPSSKAEVGALLQSWAEQLQARNPSGSGSTDAEVLKALAQSHALPVAFSALPRTKSGRSIIRYVAKMKEYTRDGDASETQKAARALAVILSKASAVDSEVMVGLFRLLAETSDDVPKKQSGKSGPGHLALQGSADLQWVLALLSAALLDSAEVIVHSDGFNKYTAENVLKTSKAVLETANQRSSNQATEVSPPKDGADVWAQRATDGRWYRAQVKSSAGDQVEVTWLRPPEEIECGQEAEYLCAATGDTSSSDSLPAAVIVPSSHDRPAPAASAGETGWLKALETSDALSRNFKELRELCEQTVSPPSQQEGQPMKVDVAQKPLTAHADSLAMLRQTNDKEVKTLAETIDALSKNSTADASNDTKQTQLNEIIKTRTSLSERKNELETERKSLLEKLNAVDKELASVDAAYEENLQQERNISLGDDSERGQAKSRHGLLSNVIAVSQVVEESLVTRRRQLADQNSRPEDGSESELAAACIKTEHARRRQLEELNAGFHAAIWSEEAASLGQQPAQVAVLRAYHARAQKIVDNAWKEAVQLAAECMGDGGALRADSEDMSRAAKRYKEIRQDLERNLERLAKFSLA